MAEFSKMQNEALQKELKRRLEGYDKLFLFVNNLAAWDATTDSWYDLFRSYQRQAANLIKEV